MADLNKNGPIAERNSPHPCHGRVTLIEEGALHEQRSAPPSFAEPDPLNRFRLVGEWGEWLATFPWTHFGTYTFATERSSPNSCIGSFKAHRRRMARRDISARYFAVVEGDADSQRLHVHALSMLGPRRKDGESDSHYRARALLSRDRRLHTEEWYAWKEAYGRARIGPLTDNIGSALYVAKYLLKERDPRWWFLPEEGWERYTA
jgi:hypothetical protein